MANRSALAAPSSGGRRLLATRPGLRALLVSLGCVVVGFVAMGLTLFPLNDVQDEIFDGAGSALSTTMILLGLIPCNIVAWVRGSRFWDAFCVVTGSITLLGLPATAITLVRYGERRSLPLDVAAAFTTVACVTGITALVSAVAGAAGRPSALIWAFVFSTGLSVACLLWGRVRGTRAALLVSLREQATSAERAAVAERQGRDADVARALAEERSTFAEERSALARDMHDGISHRLSIVALHAGAMSSRDDLTPQQLRAAALTVRDAAEGTGVMLREALTALRGVSKAPGVSSAEPSTPSATSLPARVATARASGANVALRWWELSQDDLDRSPERALAIARITEEILVNAFKYAPDQPLVIDLSVRRGLLRLLARNPLPEHRPDDAIGTGFGLIGLIERAELVGGGARCGVSVDAHFQVDVWIPWS